MNRPDRYDTIGIAYARTRREDPRLARLIRDCLGSARSVLNVGAGTGSYEPPDRAVAAAEPTNEMLLQRPLTAAPAVRCVAEALPFADRGFDASMAVLTLHHWVDRTVGLREPGRVSATQVVMFFEPLQVHGFWGLQFFPEALALDSESTPSDCRDGLGAAFWSRPEEYLRAEVQAGMSWLAMLPGGPMARDFEPELPTVPDGQGAACR